MWSGNNYGIMFKCIDWISSYPYGIFENEEKASLQHLSRTQGLHFFSKKILEVFKFDFSQIPGQSDCQISLACGNLDISLFRGSPAQFVNVDHVHLYIGEKSQDNMLVFQFSTVTVLLISCVYISVSVKDSFSMYCEKDCQCYPVVPTLKAWFLFSL